MLSGALPVTGPGSVTVGGAGAGCWARSQRAEVGACRGQRAVVGRSSTMPASTGGASAAEIALDREAGARGARQRLGRGHRQRRVPVGELVQPVVNECSTCGSVVGRHRLARRRPTRTQLGDRLLAALVHWYTPLASPATTTSAVPPSAPPGTSTRQVPSAATDHDHGTGRLPGRVEV